MTGFDPSTEYCVASGCSAWPDRPESRNVRCRPGSMAGGLQFIDSQNLMLHCNVPNSSLNMVKRKRGDPDGIYGNPGDLAARELRLRQRHLEEVIDNGKKSVFRALKLGRGFERQKLGRRQKLAREKHGDIDIKRMDAEIVALKVSIFYMKKDHWAYYACRT